MLTNTKQELGKLESSIYYQRAPDPQSISNSEGIAIQNSIPNAENNESTNSNNSFLER